MDWNIWMNMAKESRYIDRICKKYGLEYLDEHAELFKADTIIYEGNNRHRAVLRVIDSLISRNRRILGTLQWNGIKRIASHH